jgi:hypothetical protein
MNPRQVGADTVRRTLALATIAAGLLPALAGCQDGWWRWPGLDRQQNDPELTKSPRGAAFKDSISEVASFEGLRRMRVQGYGIVGGLGDKGSAECPREIRDRLIGEMKKRPEFQRVSTRRQGITPERLIDGADTAVVLVQGEIPAGAVAGSRFDLSVSAVPGSQATSLRCGRLLPCDLHVVRMLTPQAGLTGQTLATAAGPVFLNPFSDRPGAATKAPTRVGTIIGGGLVKTDRRIRLVLSRPSYSMALRVASVINARFPAEPKLADAISPSFVKLTVPPQYADDPRHFLAVVRHLYLPRDPSFATRRCRELAEEITEFGAAYENIALAWEGLGKRAIATISELYSHEDRLVAYYAALAGLRLGDDMAVPAIAEHAADANSPVRFEAITELGRRDDMPRAGRALQRLLDDEDPFICAAAYEALLEWGGVGITSYRLGRDSFWLDLIPSSTQQLIYAKRTGDRRIALFGPDLRCLPPLFYRHPGGDLTINAYDGADELTILRRMPYTKTVAAPITASLDVPELVELLGRDAPRIPQNQPTGLCVSYDTVIQALHELCDMRSVNARFLLEQKSIKELFGPSLPEGRPESEYE